MDQHEPFDSALESKGAARPTLACESGGTRSAEFLVETPLLRSDFAEPRSETLGSARHQHQKADAGHDRAGVELWLCEGTELLLFQNSADAQHPCPEDGSGLTLHLSGNTAPHTELPNLRGRMASGAEGL